jgi:hypothetical protein
MYLVIVGNNHQPFLKISEDTDPNRRKENNGVDDLDILIRERIENNLDFLEYICN